MKLCKELRENYIKDVDTMNKRYKYIQNTIDTLPNVCKNYIIQRNKTTPIGTILDSYKTLNLSYGCNRKLYPKGTYIDNSINFLYKEMWLIEIKINTVSLYDSNEKYGIDALDTNCFYYNKRNTNFYCTDEQFEAFLEKLNEWHIQAKGKARKDSKEAKKQELLDKLKQLEDTNCA